MKHKKNILFALILIVIIVSIQIILSITIWSSLNQEDIGKLGDLSNAVNTIFSGLAFGGIIYTIIIQMSDLELKRKEYTKSTKELERSSDALKEQINITIRDQKMKSQGDLIKDLFDDSEIRKFYYRIDYNQFEFNTDDSFLEKFKGGDDERRLDSLLFKYNYIGKLVRNKYLEIDDINFLIFPMLQVYNNSSVQKYLQWLDSENLKWGDSQYTRHGDFRWLMQQSLSKI